MASVNRIILLGNLGNDPDSRFTPSGDQITRISLATTWGSKDSSQQKGKSDAPFTNDKLDDIPW